MKLNLKKALATSAAIAALLANTSVAFAGADAVCETTDDGDDFCFAQDNDQFYSTNSNSGYVSNTDVGFGASGGNSQSGNDDDNSMGTGSADGTGLSDNFLNSNVTEVEDDDTVGSADSSANVGEDGNATAYAYDDDIVNVRNGNWGNLYNVTLGEAISGNNNQSGNDDDNSMTTGSATAMASALNELNSNWTTVGGSHSAHATATVGEDGNAFAFAQDNDAVWVNNSNTGTLSNTSVAVAVSGGNNQSGNDDNNSLTTGSSSADVDANNFVNNNITVVGGSDGGSSSATSNVGEDGNATSYAYDDDTVNVSNENSAEVQNQTVAQSVSGNNNQSGNDDGNSMTTGSSSGTSCSTNTANSNWTTVGADLPEGSEGGCE